MKIAENLLGAISKHHYIAVLFYLCALELLTFGSVVPKVGFYLDDWNMVSQLYFHPQQFGAMLSAYFWNDPKIVIRPVEALHYAVMYKLFGLKPLGYHVLNGVMEVGVAWFCYLILHRLTKSRVLSLIAAAIALLYPIHDSTHYWVMASSATLSLLLYVVSLWLHITGVETGRQWRVVVAYLAYAVSIFNYECYLPLFLVNVVCAVFVSRQVGRTAVLYAAAQSLPYVLWVVAFAVYSRVFIPHLTTAWVHAAQFDAGAAVNTLVRGVQVSVGVEPFAVLWHWVSRDADARSIVCWLQAGAAALLTAGMFAGFKESLPSRKLLALVACAAFAFVLLSYSIFALNSEYTPTIISFVNRVNYAGAIGAAALFAAIGCLIGGAMKPQRQPVALSVVVSGFLVFCMFGDWAMAHPWMMSAMMQRHVKELVLAHRGQYKSGDSIVLLNAPRFVQWAPVFDGAWDFGNMVKVALKDRTINGGVVSERMELTPEFVTDTSRDYLCAKYRFGSMHAVVATQLAVLPVRDFEEFIELVRTRGMDFELDRNLPAVWKKQVAAKVKGRTELQL